MPRSVELRRQAEKMRQLAKSFGDDVVIRIQILALAEQCETLALTVEDATRKPTEETQPAAPKASDRREPDPRA